jgi:hypothetical protein
VQNGLVGDVKRLVSELNAEKISEDVGKWFFPGPKGVALGFAFHSKSATKMSDLPPSMTYQGISACLSSERSSRTGSRSTGTVPNNACGVRQTQVIHSE